MFATKCCLIYSVNSSPRACRACAQRHKGMVEVLSFAREQASQQAHPAIKITRAHLTYSTICSKQPVVRLDVDINEDATPRMCRTWFSTTFRSPGRRHRRRCDTSDAQNVVFSHFLVAWTSTSTRMRHLGCTERSFPPHFAGREATRKLNTAQQGRAGVLRAPRLRKPYKPIISQL